MAQRGPKIGIKMEIRETFSEATRTLEVVWGHKYAISQSDEEGIWIYYADSLAQAIKRHKIVWEISDDVIISGQIWV
jgi:hypothetical protein